MTRLLTALLGRPVAPAAAGRGRAAGRRREPARRSAARGVFAVPLAAARGGVAFVWPRRRLRIALLVALCLAVLGAVGWMLLRGSSLSAVEKVQISGVQGHQATRIEAALRRTARGMSTMHVNVGALRAAVARFPVVRDLRVSPSFPHGLRITVIEQPPVAVLSAAGVRTAVAADGVVLGPELISGTLPSVRLSGVAPLTGHDIQDATTRAELRILGAAPPTLLGWVQSISSGSEGIVATMRGDVQIYFGGAARAHAKWLSAARVLADSNSAGATYIDVRVPARPVAGTTAPGGLGGAAASTGTGASSLSARLDEAVAGGSAGAAAAATSPAVGSSEQASSTVEPGGTGTGEASSGGTGSTEASAGAPAGGASTGESSSGAPAGEAAAGGTAGGSAGSAGATPGATESGSTTGESAGNTGVAAASGGAAAG